MLETSIALELAEWANLARDAALCGSTCTAALRYGNWPTSLSPLGPDGRSGAPARMAVVPEEGQEPSLRSERRLFVSETDIMGVASGRQKAFVSNAYRRIGVCQVVRATVLGSGQIGRFCTQCGWRGRPGPVRWSSE